MREPQRYNGIEPDDAGVYVLHSAYAELAAEVVALIAANDKLEDTLSAERIDAAKYDRMKRSHDRLNGLVERFTAEATK